MALQKSQRSSLGRLDIEIESGSSGLCLADVKVMLRDPPGAEKKDMRKKRHESKVRLILSIGHIYELKNCILDSTGKEWLITGSSLPYTVQSS